MTLLFERRFASLLGLVVLNACGAGWRRADLTPGLPGPLPARQQVQVWRNGSAARWHGVVFGPDSVSGILYHRPLECDSCRVTIPRAAVDSLRLGDPVAGFWKSVGLVIGAFFVTCAIWCPREMS